MAGEITVAFKGNLAADPELRFTPSGAAVCNFRVLDTPRVFDRDTQQWKDGTTNAHNIVVWRELAENCGESLARGMAVVGVGITKTEEWQDKETGEPRSKQVIEAMAVGPDLRWATAQVTKANRGAQGGGQQAQQQGGQQTQQQGGWGGGGQAQQPSAQGGSDPWGSGQATQPGAQGGAQGGDDPWA